MGHDFSVKQKAAAFTGIVTSVMLFVVFGTMSTAAAAPASCSAGAFTVGGVFDLTGYLACQAALASGGLPETGSNSLQIFGIALGLLAIGIAAIYVSSRERRRHTV